MCARKFYAKKYIKEIHYVDSPCCIIEKEAQLLVVPSLF